MCTHMYTLRYDANTEPRLGFLPHSGHKWGSRAVGPSAPWDRQAVGPSALWGSRAVGPSALLRCVYQADGLSQGSGRNR